MALIKIIGKSGSCFLPKSKRGFDRAIRQLADLAFFNFQKSAVKILSRNLRIANYEGIEKFCGGVRIRTVIPGFGDQSPAVGRHPLAS